MGNFLVHYKEILYFIAEIAAGALEYIGVFIVIVGSCRAIVRLLKCLVKKLPFHVAADLGKALLMALEFKVGAELIKTVVIHDMEELLILAVVIALRALLAFIIYWEMRVEEKEGNKN